MQHHRDWLRYHNSRELLRHQWGAFFNNWDILICPQMATSAFEHDHTGYAEQAADLDAKAKATVDTFTAETKGSEAVLANAKGVLVCPSITKGGFLVGVESRSCVLTKGTPKPLYYGTSAVKAGLLAGIQSYSMILVLNTPESVAKFTSDTREWEVGADASVAVAKLE